MSEHTPKDAAKTQGALKGVDPEKRRTLAKLAAGAFVTPVVASFPIDGLTISRAHAATASGSGLVKEDKDKDKDKGKHKKHHFPNGPIFPNSSQPN